MGGSGKLVTPPGVIAYVAPTWHNFNAVPKLSPFPSPSRQCSVSTCVTPPTCVVTHKASKEDFAKQTPHLSNCQFVLVCVCGFLFVCVFKCVCVCLRREEEEADEIYFFLFSLFFCCKWYGMGHVGILIDLDTRWAGILAQII